MAKTKTCTLCGLCKPLRAFWIDEQFKGSGRKARCSECLSKAEARWSAESYIAVHRFTVSEEYMIDKLSKRPTLSKALDNLFKRNPRRWHQILAAAMLLRRTEEGDRTQATWI